MRRLTPRSRKRRKRRDQLVQWLQGNERRSDMNRAIDEYLDRVMVFAHRKGDEAAAVRAELRDHLLEKVAALKAAGGLAAGLVSAGGLAAGVWVPEAGMAFSSHPVGEAPAFFSRLCRFWGNPAQFVTTYVALILAVAVASVGGAVLQAREARR